jgi:hypothetical protein
MTTHRIVDLMSYDTENRYGLSINAHDIDAEDKPTVEIQLTPTDLVFLLCGVIDKYGLASFRRAVDLIVQEDPTGQNVGLSAPARALQGLRLV